MPPEITVEIPVDWTGTILLPAIAILVSSGIAIWVASFERRRVEKDAVRTQGAQLIRALGNLARAFAHETADADAVNDASRLFEQELNAFAAHLRKSDVVVAKFVAVVSTKADEGPIEHMPRTAIWLMTAVELWLRGELKSREFEANMPADRSGWSEHVDLGDHFAILRGEPATGIPDSVVTRVRRIQSN